MYEITWHNQMIYATVNINNQLRIIEAHSINYHKEHQTGPKYTFPPVSIFTQYSCKIIIQVIIYFTRNIRHATAVTRQAGGGLL